MKRALAALSVLMVLAGCTSGTRTNPTKPSAVSQAPTPSSTPDDPISALVNALEDTSNAEEQWLGGHDAYTAKLSDLTGGGLHLPSTVTVTLQIRGADSYCVQATDTALPGKVSHLDSTVDSGNDLFEGPCTAGRTTPIQGTPAPTPTEVLENQVLDAVTAQETYLTDHGAVTATVANLVGRDFTPDKAVTLTILVRGTDAYCIAGSSAAAPGVLRHYDTSDGDLVDGPCGSGSPTP